MAGDGPVGPVPDGSLPPPAGPPEVYYGPDVPPGGCPSGAVCIPTAEPPVEQVCDGESFSWTDPGSWGDQAQCATVYLLYGIYQGIYEVLDAINALIAALQAGFTDLLNKLEWLFVPPEGMWSGIADDAVAMWQDSPLAEWVTAVQGLAPPATAETCQGPGVGPVTLVEDVEVPQMYPLSTCPGSWGADVAPMVKGVLSLGVILGGAWRMWDMLAGSAGAYRGGGRHMSDSEWL